MTSWAWALTVLLLAANAFFVAAEFALIAARRDRLEALVEQGRSSAKAVIKASENLSLMLAGCQLGITICSILLGKVGEPAIAQSPGRSPWGGRACRGAAAPDLVHGVAGTGRGAAHPAG